MRGMDREALGLQVPLASYGTCKTERLSIHVPAEGLMILHISDVFLASDDRT